MFAFQKRKRQETKQGGEFHANIYLTRLERTEPSLLLFCAGAFNERYGEVSPTTLSLGFL